MNTNILSLLLTALLSVVGSFWLYTYKDGQKKKQEQQDRLYSPIKFYLTLIRNLRKETDDVLREKNNTQLPQVSNPELNDHDLAEIAEPFYKTEAILLQDMFKYVKELLECIKSNAQYVKDKDWPLILNLFETYHMRQAVYFDKDGNFDAGKIKGLTSGLRLGKAFGLDDAINNLYDSVTSESEEDFCSCLDILDF